MKLFITLAMLTALSVGLAVAPMPAQPAADFSKSIQPFVKQHCIQCHGPAKQSANLRLDNLDPDLVKGKDVERWNDVRLRLLAGEMPPEKEPRPKAGDSQRVVEWIAAELKKNPQVKLRQPPDFNHPRSGNRIDHHALFHPAPGTVASSPRRVWRLSGQGYTELAKELQGTIRQFVQPLPGGPEGGFTDYAALLLIDEPSVNQLMRNADGIVDFQSTPLNKGGKILVRPSKELIALADPAVKLTRAVMEAGIRKQFLLVLQREPTADELKRYVDLMEKNIKEAGREVGVRTALTAVMLVPEALYRTEIGAGQADAHGRFRLAPRETAYALAFALTDKRPDAVLLAAAEQGKLATRDGVAEQVRRLLDDPKTEKPRILRFFREYFGYHNAPEVFKDDKEFRDHEAAMLVADTDRLVEHILQKDKNVLVELLTTPESFVGTWTGDKRRMPKKAVYLSYNLDSLPAEQPVKLPAEQRAGILTQPSWLVAWSENADNHAILRGKWIRERLLGGTIPDLPITVNAQLPEAPEKTLRQRMEVTKDAYCWNCHQRMNPLGLTFEMYDHFGRFRATELGRPVDATGTIERSGDPAVDGQIGNAIELVKKLAASEHVRQVFIRHAFRYWMGRNETLSDGPTLVAADKAYVESGGSMKALIASLLTSDPFLLRK